MSTSGKSSAPSVKAEKQSANSRVRRHSIIPIPPKHHKKKKKIPDSDNESVTSSSSAPATPKATCPLRLLLAGMMQSKDSDGKCPLRRVQLWHVIPLCLLAVINLLLVILALLGLAGYRVALGLKGIMARMAKIDVDYSPFVDGLVVTEVADGIEVVS